MSNHRADWISPPGETIRSLLHKRNFSAAQLAVALNIGSTNTLKLLAGQFSIDRTIASGLERHLGGSSGFWLSRETRYRECIEEKAREEQNLGPWLDAVNFRELANWGWLDDRKGRLDRGGTLLGFFGVTCISEWERRYGEVLKKARFRAHGLEDASLLALTCWLRRGELVGQTFKLSPWSESVLRNSLGQMRELTREPDADVFLPALQALCAQAGIALVVARAPAGSKVSGAVIALPSGSPLILLSFRYRSDDQFWFSYFHEVGHLLLHGPDKTFFEGDSITESSVEEAEANEFAEDLLVPGYFKDLLQDSHPSQPRQFLRLAKTIGVSPGILLGQLQHMGLVPHDRFNRYKKRYEWEEVAPTP